MVDNNDKHPFSIPAANTAYALVGIKCRCVIASVVTLATSPSRRVMLQMRAVLATSMGRLSPMGAPLEAGGMGAPDPTANLDSGRLLRDVPLGCVAAFSGGASEKGLWLADAVGVDGAGVGSGSLAARHMVRRSACSCASADALLGCHGRGSVKKRGVTKK